MNILTKIKATTAALLVIVVVLGVVITIAHLVEGRVVRRSIASLRLTGALFTRASVVRLIFVGGDTSQVDELRGVDEKIMSLITVVQREFPVQHPTQTALNDLAKAHERAISVTDDAMTVGVGSVFNGERNDIVEEVSVVSRGMIADISVVNAVNAADLTRTRRLANMLLLSGLGVMVMGTLGVTYIIYRALARPLVDLCDSLERGEYGADTQIKVVNSKKSTSEVAKLDAALKVLSRKVELLREGELRDS